MSDHWRISALVTQIKDNTERYFEELLKKWKPKKSKLIDIAKIIKGR